MTQGMMVDAKITTSEQLRLCLEKDTASWERLGYLDGKETPDAEDDYKGKLGLFRDAQESARDSFKPIAPGRSSDERRIL